MSSGHKRAGIFVATMTGLAELCAEEIERALGAAGICCQRHLMDGVEIDALNGFDLLVIVSSTYGHGEIPDNGQALFAALEGGVDLSGKRYVIFGLGDRTYADTFCAASARWDGVLTACGATRIMDIVRHDASSGTLAEDVAGEWATGWASMVA
jgi:MioC protein